MRSRGFGARPRGRTPAADPGRVWSRVAVARLLLVLSTGGGLVGCSLAGPRDYNPFRTSDARRISVVIENRNSRPVEVELLSGTRTVSLGRVTGNGRSGVTIPWSETSDVSFRIDPLVAPRHTTSVVRVAPGQEVELWVQDPVELSVIRR